MDEYWVSVNCSFIEKVRASTAEEAVKKAEKSYKYGKGRFPREYVEVCLEKLDFAQVED